MSYERNKAPLALMEQIIMILVFALASAVCLQGFVYANNLSKNGAWQQEASSKAQTVVEYCKAEQGDLDAVCEALSGERTERGLRIMDTEADMQIVLELTDSTEYLQRAKVTAFVDEKEIYTVNAAWQMAAGENE